MTRLTWNWLPPRRYAIRVVRSASAPGGASANYLTTVAGAVILFRDYASAMAVVNDRARRKWHSPYTTYHPVEYRP